MSSNSPTCCLGAGGHGIVVAMQLCRRESGKVAFADSQKQIGSWVDGFEVIANSLDAVDGYEFLITVGDNHVRSRLQREAIANGLVLKSFVADPDHYFAPPPGPGTVVLAGAVVNPRAALGSGVIVNSGAIVEHDCVVGDFVHLSPGAILAGNARVGAGSWIGAGATVLPGVEVHQDVIVGAGAVVTRDLTAGIYVGSPARKLG